MKRSIKGGHAPIYSYSSCPLPAIATRVRACERGNHKCFNQVTILYIIYRYVRNQSVSNIYDITFFWRLVFFRKSTLFTFSVLAYTQYSRESNLSHLLFFPQIFKETLIISDMGVRSITTQDYQTLIRIPYNVSVL